MSSNRFCVFFRSYWTHAILDVLLDQQQKNSENNDTNSTNTTASSSDNPPQIAINEICEATAIKKDDVISTMQTLNLINYYRGQYVLTLNEDLKSRHEKEKAKRKIRIDPSALHWTPKDWSKRAKW